MSKVRIQTLAVAGCGALFCLLTPAVASTMQETFPTDPASRGWVASGDPSLFHWSSANQNLEVTWDSSKPNSYFCYPLDRTLERMDTFTLEFDLFLSDFASGVDPLKTNTFQIAVGFINLAQASTPAFHRGNGSESPNLVEFSFFPDPGGAWMWGPSLTAVLIDWTGTNWGSGGFLPAGLSSNHWVHVAMGYSNQTLRTTLSQNGKVFATISDTHTGAGFRDFQVDHVAIASYSDAGQDPAYSGSILAHGKIDNLTVTIDPPGIGTFTACATNGVWQAQIHARTNWLYTLERSTNLTQWITVPPTLTGAGTTLILEDTSPPANGAVYRVKGVK